jgi:hypothetical protein
MDFKKVCILLLFFIFSTQLVFGDRKVLIYYFKNITGDEEYTDLTHTIPLYLHTDLEKSKNGNKYYLIYEEGVEFLHEDGSNDLWERNLLRKIGNKKNVDEIIFGSFYVDKGKPVVLGNIFYVNGGFILDLTEKNSEYYNSLQGVEELPVDELANYVPEKSGKTYNPRFERLLDYGTERAHITVQAAGGVLFPLDEWADLYPPGIFSEVSIIYYPRMNIVPLGIGVSTNFAGLKRDEDQPFIDSNVSIFSFGVALQYLFDFKGFFEGIALDANTGLSISYLDINENTWSSVDPFVKASINFVFNPFRKVHLSLRTGLFTIDYREMPIDSIFGEIGIWIY